MGITGMFRCTFVVAVSILAGAITAQAQSVPGSVKYPCGSPQGRRISTSVNASDVSIDTGAQGDCGWLFTIDPATHNKRFRVHPDGSADLDIYFYDAHGRYVGDEASSVLAPAARACGDLFEDPDHVAYRVPASASTSIVVLSPNPNCAKQQDVGFTYTTYAN